MLKFLASLFQDFDSEDFEPNSELWGWHRRPSSKEDVYYRYGTPYRYSIEVYIDPSDGIRVGWMAASISDAELQQAGKDFVKYLPEFAHYAFRIDYQR
jgi:hypothetical protein